MKCIICGNEIPSGEAFCPVCGAAAPGEHTSYGTEPAPAPAPQPASQPAAENSYPQPAIQGYAPQSAGGKSGGERILQPDYGRYVPKTPSDGTAFSYSASPQQTPGFQAVSDYDPYAGVQPVRIAASKDPQGGEGAKKGKKTGLIIACAAGGVAVIALLVLFLMGMFHFKNGTYIWDDYAFDGTSLQLELKGEKGILTATYRGKTDTQEVEVVIDGSKAYISANGKYIEGKYDRRDQTISFADDSLQGFDIVMKKE